MKRPRSLGQPFTRWSIRKLAHYLAAKKHRKVVVSRERLRQILGLQRRLRDFGASVRAQRALTHRGIFREALTWMEIHGGTPETVEHWITVLAERGAEEPVMAPGQDGADPQPTQSPQTAARRRPATQAAARSITLGCDFFDRLVGFGELERDEQANQRPGRIDFTRAETELRAARISVVIVVQALAAGQQRQEPQVRRGVVEVLVSTAWHSPLIDDDSTNT